MYLRTDEGWLYLAVVIDLWSRAVIGWSMSPRMTAQLACDALQMALWRRKRPENVIVHRVRKSAASGGNCTLLWTQIPTGSNAYWKRNMAYNRRSVAETAMYRVKQLFGGHLTLRDYDAQVGEAMAMIRALNKLTLAGMPESVRTA